MFDSLKYAKILEESGLTRKQAETHVQVLKDVIGEEMATKDDLNRLDAKLDHVEYSLRTEIKLLESRIVIKLGGLMAALLATGLTAVKLFLV